MIELKKDFEVKKLAMRFHQVFKDNVFAIYEVTQPHADDDCESKWFELWKIVIKQPDIYHNDEYEMVMGDEQFGSNAWSCSNEKHLNKVIKNNFPNHPMATTGFKC